eukprot:3303387-Amphidinium_carterae.1
MCSSSSTVRTTDVAVPSAFDAAGGLPSDVTCMASATSSSDGQGGSKPHPRTDRQAILNLWNHAKEREGDSSNATARLSSVPILCWDLQSFPKPQFVSNGFKEGTTFCGRW